MSAPVPEKQLCESPASEGKKRPASPSAEDEPSKVLKVEGGKVGSRGKEEVGEFAETVEMKEMRVKLEHALGKLGQDTRNSLLLQAVHHYTEVKKLRDDLLVQVGELDAPFADLILRKAREEGGKPDE